MKQLFILVTIIFLFNQNTNAQEKNCEVALNAIKGTYTGACTDGKANGQGKSSGTDSFEGNFKDGYPDGKGTYTWKNKNYYEGNFKKGRLDGEGEMHYKNISGGDSAIVKGFWKKDKYIGRFEKPFLVKSKSSRISKIDYTMGNKKGRSIAVTTHQLIGTGADGIIAISSVSVVTGTYTMKFDQNLSNGSTTRLQDVVFPFRAIFFLSNGDQAELLFNEEADYDVTLDIL